MPDIFLSYTRDDLTTARRFAEAFEREGFTVWWDQTLNPGEAFDEVTEKALNEARAVVVLWSKKSVASRWVRAEATQANENKTLVPVMIEPCKRPIMFELTHTADLSNWKGSPDDAGWQSYLAGVKRLVVKETGGAGSPTAISLPVRAPRQFGPRTLIGVVAVLAVVAGVYWIASRSPKVAPKPTEAVVATSSATAQEVTLAVLPFADMSPAHDQEYFSDGLSEEILNQLAQIKTLRVTGRTSSFSFKGKNEDLRTIADKLGVGNLLEGSIRKDGNQLRIIAQLINGKDGAHLWSKTYDRDLSGIFALQEEIAKDVAKALSITLDVGDFAGVAGMTRNVDAYDAFLTGVALMRSSKPDSVRLGIEQLKRAYALDPSFALAHAVLSGSYRGIAAVLLTEESPHTWREKSDEELDAARRLAPDAFYVQVGLAEQSVARGKWSAAVRQYQLATSAGLPSGTLDAIELNAGDDGLPAQFLWRVGRFGEAIALLEQARTRDPLNVGVSIYLAEAYADAARFDAAFSEWERGSHLEGGQVFVSAGGFLTALATRDRPALNKWLDSLISAGKLPGSDINVTMRRFLDRPQQAKEELHRRMQTATGADWRPTASWLAYFGDPDGALELFRRESRNADNAGELAILFWRPVMRDVRKLPGFKDLVRDIGLVDFWQEFGWPDLCKPVGTEDFECH